MARNRSGSVVLIRRSVRLGHVAIALAAFVALATCAPQASAQQREEVDVALVLAVDISASMSKPELDIQRKGYAQALTDPQVLQAIASGAYGRIAVTYFEFAGVTSQKVLVPWTIIDGPENAAEVAKKISVLPAWQSRRTSISGALNVASDLLQQNPYEGIKQVIDVSGDGANNEGPLVTETRDKIAAQGITINGLPVMSGEAPMPYDVPALDRYFAECVIGGPGHFVMPVNGWEQFPQAIRRKLLLELATRPPAGSGEQKLPIVLIQGEPAYDDCLIGEKLWRGDPRQHMYDPERLQKHRR